MAFARSMSACGLRVLTPELPDSRDYRIQPSDVQAIGDSVQWLQNTTGRPVGIDGPEFFRRAGTDGGSKTAIFQ